MPGDTLYLKIDKNVRARSRTVSLGDIAELNCAKKPVENKVKTMRLPTEHIKGPGRYVFSVFDVIEVIQQEYPNLEISNLGETDFIITVEKEKKPSEVTSWCKTILVCLLSFFGASFSIMAFNNDIGVRTLFGQIYEQLTGTASDGFTLLEVSYSLGVGLGILMFFHHFAGKQEMADPTPLEVEMRTYEDDVDDTLIEAGNRNSGQEASV
jgi:stage V sporulation protein AA